MLAIQENSDKTFCQLQWRLSNCQKQIEDMLRDYIDVIEWELLFALMHFNMWQIVRVNVV